MNFIRSLWNKVKAFFSNLFGKKAPAAAEPTVAEPVALHPEAQAKIDTFEAAFAAAEKIDYNPKWANGTGYFDNAVDGDEALKLAEGQIIASTTLAGNDRKLVIVGTRFGNVVVFQRYTKNEGVYTFNAPTRFERWYPHNLNRSLTVENMTFIFKDQFSVEAEDVSIPA